MSDLVIFLAVAAMIGVAAARLVRVRLGRTAKDARSRLDTLRRMAGDHRQAWARP